MANPIFFCFLVRIFYLLQGTARIDGTSLRGLHVCDPGLAVPAREHGDVDALQNADHDLLDALVRVVLDGDVDGHVVTVVVQLTVQGRFQLKLT